MIFSVLILGSATGTKSSGFGMWVWGYTVWLMYKRRNSDLVSLYKVLLGFDLFACVVGVCVYLFSDSSIFTVIGYSYVGFITLLGCVTLLTYGMYTFFKSQIEPDSDVVKNNVNRNLHINFTNNGNLTSSGSTTSKDLPIPNTETLVADDKFWEIASQELKSNNINEALWARLFSETDGDDNKTKARYLKNRVDELKAEFQKEKISKDLSDYLLNLNKSIESIDKNSAKSNLDIGMTIYNGNTEIDANHSKAFDFIHKAAINGNHDAQFNLSLMYWKGDGIKKDKAKAYAWCRIASSHVPDAKANVKYFSKDINTTEVFESDRLVKEFLKRIDDNFRGVTVVNSANVIPEFIPSIKKPSSSVDYSKLKVDECLAENLYDEYMLGEFKCYELYNGKAMVVTETRKLVYTNINALRSALDTFKRSGVFTLDNLVHETRLKN